MRAAGRLAMQTIPSGTRPVLLAVLATLTFASAQAAEFGHTRITSPLGEPLAIDVPITQLTHAESNSLVVRLAPPEAWKEAGLTPPVELDKLSLDMVPGRRADSRIVRVRSAERFNRPVADLLLHVQTAAGRQQVQISVLAPVSTPPGSTILVGRGDRLWSIAEAHAQPGVTIYQLMVALQRANPEAFIHHNLNLVKAGARLRMPDRAAMTAISDREARRIFQQQLLAFQQYRQRLAARTVARVDDAETAARGVVTELAPASASPEAPAPRDELKLSSGNPQAEESDREVSTQKGIADSEARVSTLEENVRHLNQALQMQGEAAKEAMVGGAKSLGQSLSDVAGAVTEILAPSPEGERKPSTESRASVGGRSAADQGASPAGAPDGGASEAADGAVEPGTGPVAGTGPEVSAPASGQNGAGASGTGPVAAVQGQAPAGQETPTPVEGAGNKADTQTTESGGAPEAGQGAPSATAETATESQDRQAAPETEGSTGVRAAHGDAAPSHAQAAHAEGGGDAKAPAAGREAAPARAGTPVFTAPSGSASASAESSAESAERAGRADRDARTARGRPVPDPAPPIPDSAASGTGASWIQKNFLAFLAGLLALIVLLIAWILRRANTRPHDGQNGSVVITDAMVQEKLDEIDLDLRSPPAEPAGREHPGRPRP